MTGKPSIQPPRPARQIDLDGAIYRQDSAIPRTTMNIPPPPKPSTSKQAPPAKEK